MFIGTVIRQGEQIHNQNNTIKQYKEENEGLRNELNFRILNNNRCKRLLANALEYLDAIADVNRWNNDESFKQMSRDLLINELKEKIKKELDNASNID